MTDKRMDYFDRTGGDEFNRAEFDAFARSLGAVIRLVPDDPPANPKPNGSGIDRSKRPVSLEYRQMVRDAKAFFGGDIQAGLTEMLAPYRVSDTHGLTPRQCAEISEKIEILRALAVRTAGV